MFIVCLVGLFIMSVIIHCLSHKQTYSLTIAVPFTYTVLVRERGCVFSI